MASITVTFKERQKQRLDMFPHQYGDAALIFEKPLLAFIAFIGAAVAQSDGFIKDRCTTMSTRSVSDVLMTETFTEEQLRCIIRNGINARFRIFTL